jgi:predicted aspartyl protease
MLLDTGADVSLVPRDAIARLGLGESATATYQLVGFDGNVSTAQAVRLSLVLCGRVFSGRFLVIDQPLGIIGRNVLNSLSLVFDGPQLTWRPL